MTEELKTKDSGQKKQPKPKQQQKPLTEEEIQERKTSRTTLGLAKSIAARFGEEI